MSRKPYQLPPGVRFLTDAERQARKAGKGAAAGVDTFHEKATGDGWQLPVPRIRRRKRRRPFRPPAGIFRRPR